MTRKHSPQSAASRSDRFRSARACLWEALQLCLVLMTIGLLPINSVQDILTTTGTSMPTPTEEESAPPVEESQDGDGELEEAWQPSRRRVRAMFVAPVCPLPTAAIVVKAGGAVRTAAAHLPGSEHSRRNGLGTAIRC